MAYFQPNRKFKTALEQELYKNQIIDLYLARKSQGEIAKLIGISQSAVSQWIRKITKEWRDERFKNLDDIKFEELQRINKIEAEMWEMWERSKIKDKKSVIKETVYKIENIRQPGDKGDSIPYAGRVQDKMTEAEGNMEYMHQIQWCVEQRAKLIGLYATVKIAPTDPTGTKELGHGANETLINKLLDMVSNRQEAANRLPTSEAEWKPKQLTTDVIETFETESGQFEIRQDDDPVTKALKRRALDQIENQSNPEN